MSPFHDFCYFRCVSHCTLPVMCTNCSFVHLYLLFYCSLWSQQFPRCFLFVFIVVYFWQFTLRELFAQCWYHFSCFVLLHSICRRRIFCIYSRFATFSLHIHKSALFLLCPYDSQQHWFPVKVQKFCLFDVSVDFLAIFSTHRRAISELPAATLTMPLDLATQISCRTEIFRQSEYIFSSFFAF